LNAGRIDPHPQRRVANAAASNDASTLSQPIRLQSDTWLALGRTVQNTLLVTADEVIE
jgi:hypothetical protein